MTDKEKELQKELEKEAEEYVMREDVITENARVPFDNGYGFQTVSFEDEVKKGFKDGYNKANEWHYVKDGKLDDVIDTWDKKRKYLIMVRFMNRLGKYDEIPLLAHFEHHSEKWCTSKIDYLHNFYITWWKEIVLPKESEEE